VRAAARLARQRAGEVSPTASHRPDSKFVAPAPAELAKQFAPLEILELLGQGGMGRCTRPTAEAQPAGGAQDPARRRGRRPGLCRALRREAQALAQLNHPGIVGVYDFGEAAGCTTSSWSSWTASTCGKMLQAGNLRPHEALAIVPRSVKRCNYAHDAGSSTASCGRRLPPGALPQVDRVHELHGKLVQPPASPKS